MEAEKGVELLKENFHCAEFLTKSAVLLLLLLFFECAVVGIFSVKRWAWWWLCLCVFCNMLLLESFSVKRWAWIRTVTLFQAHFWLLSRACQCQMGRLWSYLDLISLGRIRGFDFTRRQTIHGPNPKQVGWRCHTRIRIYLCFCKDCNTCSDMHHSSTLFAEILWCCLVVVFSVKSTLVIVSFLYLWFYVVPLLVYVFDSSTLIWSWGICLVLCLRLPCCVHAIHQSLGSLNRFSNMLW